MLVHLAQHASTRPSGAFEAIPLRWHRDIASMPTREESEITALASDPIGAACRQAVRRLGQRLYDMRGSTEAMREVIDRAADHDPAHAGQRASIMDSAWNGIGEGSDRWWS
ncbi:hypothetical protein [Methylobacterium sp. CM6244]